MMNKLNNAVKNGVVAPMAWLKLTGMNRSDTLPPTTDATNTTARTAIFAKCLLLFRFCLGTRPNDRVAAANTRHITMWHMVKNMGNLNPHTESKYLLSKMTPMLLKYHAAIMDNVYALMEEATGRGVCSGVSASSQKGHGQRG